MAMHFFPFLNSHVQESRVLRHLQPEGRLPGVRCYSVPQVPGTVMMILMTALMPLCKSFRPVNWATWTTGNWGVLLVNVSLPVCLRLSDCLSLFFCLSVFVSLCLAVSLFVCLCLYVCQLSIHLSFIDLSVWCFYAIFISTFFFLEKFKCQLMEDGRKGGRGNEKEVRGWR